MWMQGVRASLSATARTITSSGAAQLAGQVRSRDLSASEVLEAHIETIEALNPSLNAIVLPLFESARAEAADIDERLARGEAVGPLAGVPVTIKELFDVAGTPSSLGLEGRDQPAEQDDPLVTRLRDAGALAIGKTNLAQLVIFVESDNPVYGRTDNPWDLERTPGGSSGGEGAAVVSGCSALGLGSDVGGSVRVPAHFSGICGLKPTSGRLPLESRIHANFFPHQDAIVDQPGPFAREVADVDLGYRVLAGPINSIWRPPTPGRTRSRVSMSATTAATGSFRHHLPSAGRLQTPLRLCPPRERWSGSSPFLSQSEHRTSTTGSSPPTAPSGPESFWPAPGSTAGSKP